MVPVCFRFGGPSTWSVSASVVSQHGLSQILWPLNMVCFRFRGLFKWSRSVSDSVSPQHGPGPFQMLWPLNMVCFRFRGLSTWSVSDSVASQHGLFQIPWPLNMVLDSQCVAIYNDVFRFLLQIKRALYALHHLSFSGQWSMVQERSPIIINDDWNHVQSSVWLYVIIIGHIIMILLMIKLLSNKCSIIHSCKIIVVIFILHFKVKDFSFVYAVNHQNWIVHVAIRWRASMPPDMESITRQWPFRRTAT